MDLAVFFARVRDHYVEQFEAFAKRQRDSVQRGGAEVKFELSESSGLYRRLCCVDFVRNDAASEAVEFAPENILEFNEIAQNFGKMALSITALRWDSVVVHHDLIELPARELDEWFEKWFDPDDRRFDPEARVCKIIHSLLLSFGVMSIDFGTAPADALVDLLELLERAGAASAKIDSTLPVVH